MKQKSRKRTRSLTAITLAVSLVALILWGASMFCITNAVAQLCYDILYTEENGFADRISNSCRLDSALEDDNGLPGFVEDRMWAALDRGSSSSFYARSSDDDLNVLRNDAVKSQAAVIFYDADGNVLDECGDFFYFSYVTEEKWQAGLEETGADGYAKVPLDLGLFSDAERADLEAMDRNLYGSVTAMRFTGVLDGCILTPGKIEYVREGEFLDALSKTEPTEHSVSADGTEESFYYEYVTSDIIASQNVPWNTLWKREEPLSGETITLYTTRPELNLYDQGGSVTYDGVKYENLAALLAYIGPTDENEWSNKYYTASRHGLSSTVLFTPRYYYDRTLSPPLQFYMVTAVEFSPLRIAFHELRNVYIATFLLAVLCVWIIRRFIRRRLIEPVELVNDSISEGWTNFLSLTKDPDWREPFELVQHYKETQDQLRAGKNEITRLNTALEYAKDAEQNRRQMTSNIAHELKTPLAVIHSYAEGLKEHIAEGKREKYIDVILSESERLDDMVLELLDLSRLEAGKVKLSVEEFSLSELARGVFERLERAAQAKDLRIEYDFPENCTVTADEGRIRQVVENFATNAVKYTPSGGTVRVRITVQHYSTSARADTTFSVENDSAPLSADALSKVWDTFYRADEARSGGGTGLGLAIAKNIVELHGGHCSVYNTKNGVMFQFTI